MALKDIGDPLNIFRLRDADGNEFDVWVPGGPKSVSENKAAASSLNLSGGGPGRYTTGDPIAAHAEWRSLHGGRGGDFFVDDPSRFYDGENAWTATEGRWHPVPKWYFASGIRTAHEMLGDNVSWQKCVGNCRYMAATFTVGGSDLGADNVHVWLRKRGSPGTFTAEIWTNSGGVPSAIVASATGTVTASAFPQGLTRFWPFDLSAAANLTASTAYWVVVYGASGDTTDNYWEVGLDKTVSTGVSSAAGSSWAAAGRLQCRVSNADVERKWHFYSLRHDLYAVSQRNDGTASKLFINGHRGEPTSATSTVITNTNASYTADRWIGAWIKIINGTGQGQNPRQITDNDATTITTAAWDITPDNTSEYVIYKTPYWTDISPGAGDLIDGVVKDVTVFNGIAAYAQGASVNVLKHRFNAAAATPAHEFDDDGTNKADFLEADNNSVDGTVIWRGLLSSMQVSRSNSTAWATDLTFGTGITISDSTYDITGLLAKSGQLFVFKENEVGYVVNDRYTRLNSEIGDFPASINGQAHAGQGSFVFFNWLGKLQRLYGESLDNINLHLAKADWGVPSAIIAHPAGLLIAIDGGDNNVSTVQFFDGLGLHEVYRAPEAGKRVRNIYWQANEGTNRWLWISVGGELVYIPFPEWELAPHLDTAQAFMHEAVIETSTVDWGNVQSSKLFKDFLVNAQSLTATGIEVWIDYQTDDDIDSDTWYEADNGVITTTPSGVVLLLLDGVKLIRFRVRIYTNDADVPPMIRGMAAGGASSVPEKKIWAFPVKFGTVAEDIHEDGQSTEEFLTWVKDVSENIKVVWVSSIIYGMHGKPCYVEFTDNRYDRIDDDGTPEGVGYMVVREL